MLCRSISVRAVRVIYTDSTFRAIASDKAVFTLLVRVKTGIAVLFIETYRYHNIQFPCNRFETVYSSIFFDCFGKFIKIVISLLTEIQVLKQFRQ